MKILVAQACQAVAASGRIENVLGNCSVKVRVKTVASGEAHEHVITVLQIVSEEFRAAGFPTEPVGKILHIPNVDIVILFFANQCNSLDFR